VIGITSMQHDPSHNRFRSLAWGTCAVDILGVVVLVMIGAILRIVLDEVSQNP